MSIEKWGWVSILAVAACLVLLVFGLTVVTSDWKAETHQAAAAWVQAIGAIAAIFGAYALGERQMRHAATREESARADRLRATHEGIRVIADGARTEILEVAPALRGVHVDVDLLSAGLRPAAFSAMAEALGRIPVLDVQNGNLVQSIVGLQQQMIALLPLLRNALEPLKFPVPGAGHATVSVAKTTDARDLLALARAAYSSYYRITLCCPRPGDEQTVLPTLDETLNKMFGG